MEIGDFARYKNTGTVGKVVDKYSESGVEWIELDNKLVYRVEYLEPASEGEYKASSVKDRAEGLSIEQIERMKEELMKAERHAYATPSGGG
ncbi:MAG: DUF2098 family protein [Methanomassiliicoccales archaeon]|nr:MAG: DUF2098 family protein [Methanomassiliicoccales archaeon]